MKFFLLLSLIAVSESLLLNSWDLWHTNRLRQPFAMCKADFPTNLLVGFNFNAP
jgi:hypothetical protein